MSGEAQFSVYYALQCAVKCVQYNAVQFIVQCSAVFSRDYSSVYCRAVFSAVKYRAVQCSVQYSAL